MQKNIAVTIEFTSTADISTVQAECTEIAKKLDTNSMVIGCRGDKFVVSVGFYMKNSETEIKEKIEKVIEIAKNFQNDGEIENLAIYHGFYITNIC